MEVTVEGSENRWRRFKGDMAADDFELDELDELEQGGGGGVEPSDALLRSRLDAIADGRKPLFRRKKKVVVVISALVLLWICGSVLYLSGGADKIVDYYKQQKGAGGAETEGEPAVSVPTVEVAPAVDGGKQEGGQEQGQSAGEDTAHDSKGADAPVLDDGGADSGEKPVPEDSTDVSRRPPITLSDLRSGRLFTYSTQLRFVKPPQQLENDEGWFYYFDVHAIEAQKSSSTDKTKKLADSLTFEYEEAHHKITTFVPNYDMTWAIVGTDVQKLFRHSSLAYYWLYNIDTKEYKPLAVDEKGVMIKLSYATWSPKYNYISYHYDNNVYILDVSTGKVEQITHEDEHSILLNGKTDWVYEEEVLADDKAIWWSPDESTFVFMKTLEKDVPLYNIDLFVQGSGGATKYPKSEQIAYPKPGFKNPQVSLHSFNLKDQTITEIQRADSQLGDEYIIYEVFFVDDDNLLVKEADRESNRLEVRHFKPSSKESKVVHRVNANEDYQGWIEKFNAPLIIPADQSQGREVAGYVDTYVVEGYNHLCYFDSPTAEPKPLTKGNWEVVTGELAFDFTKQLVYFSASKKSVDKHLYSVHLTSGEITAVTKESEDGYYDTWFSPNAKYAAKYRAGPDDESMELINLEDSSMILPFSQKTLYMMSKDAFYFPERKFHRVNVDTDEDGSPVTLNVLEYLPQNFDPNKKYPLLVHYYAGPGSQVVKYSISLDFEDVVSSSLDAVVLYIEPRGTAGQGWRFRSWANKKIGYWEPRDIVTVTKMWLEKGFIDTDKVACWGWSYGGFTTLKTLEYDHGETFKYGMAVAPVTNWLLYDSIYTERYMDKPSNNKEGYAVSQIRDVEALSKVERFLVMHGTADDNVHIQNTYGLLDLLTLKSVENYDVHVFPDSEHSILYHNANAVVYDKLFNWLKDAFDGDFKNLGHR